MQISIISKSIPSIVAVSTKQAMLNYTIKFPPCPSLLSWFNQNISDFIAKLNNSIHPQHVYHLFQVMMWPEGKPLSNLKTTLHEHFVSGIAPNLCLLMEKGRRSLGESSKYYKLPLFFCDVTPCNFNLFTRVLSNGTKNLSQC